MVRGWPLTLGSGCLVLPLLLLLLLLLVCRLEDLLQLLQEQ
jgi:hypothetical protein